MLNEAPRAKRGMASAGLLALLLGCGCQATSCPSADCTHPALVVELVAGDWTPGNYVVSITESQRTFECRFEKGPDGTGGQAGNPNQDEFDLARTCDHVSGETAAPWDAPSWYEESNKSITIRFPHATKRLALSVTHDGRTLLDEELTPSYMKSYPYGRDCSECVNASETLTLPTDGP